MINRTIFGQNLLLNVFVHFYPKIVFQLIFLCENSWLIDLRRFKDTPLQSGKTLFLKLSLNLLLLDHSLPAFNPILCSKFGNKTLKAFYRTFFWILKPHMLYHKTIPAASVRHCPPNCFTECNRVVNFPISPETIRQFSEQEI